MTEEEWLSCEDPKMMLKYLPRSATDRKLRLFVCGCWRASWARLKKSEGAQEIIEAIEGNVDGLVNYQDVDRMVNTASAKCRRPPRSILYYVTFAWEQDVFLAAHSACTHSKNDPRYFSSLLRDIFPFHPITLSPSWLTSTVSALAHQMYDSRDFSAMPILADALMDASCDNETILTHCRGPGPHVRGCFVIDLLTGWE
jgi:hypothetical protein